MGLEWLFALIRNPGIMLKLFKIKSHYGQHSTGIMHNAKKTPSIAVLKGIVAYTRVITRHFLTRANVEKIRKI